MSIEFVTKDHKTDFLSVIVAAGAMKELPGTLASARAGLDAMGMPYEVICVTDGRDADVMGALSTIQDTWPELVVLGHRPWTDDDAALSIALRRARGSLVLTMAGWPEVKPESLSRLLAELGDSDIVSAVRTGLPTGKLQAMRRSAFGRLLARLFGQSPSDPFCRTRLARKAALEDVANFGVRQHFIPVIAGERGYKLHEVELPSASNSETTKTRYVFHLLGHLTAFFDAITLYVVLKFLRRPLRFFGSIGLPIFLLGGVATAVLLAQRLFGNPLADRPALIFAVLMVVLGIQIVAIGLVGEIIIFANSRRMKQYTVRNIIGRDTPPATAIEDTSIPGPEPRVG